MNKVLEVENISKAYVPITLSTAFNKVERANRTIHAVDNVSFCVEEGEIYGLLGPNGAGKSTIIKMITGLINKDNGKIVVAGHNIDSERRMASENIGAIIETPSMFSRMSAIDNLRYFATLEGNVDENKINNALATVGLSDRAGDKVGTYSLGMKQRLGIAQAIMSSPKLLVLDEPTNGLDPEWIINMRDLIKKLAHEYKVSVLVSSHILGEMQELCDRVGILYRGKLIKEISVDEIGELSQDSRTIAAYSVGDVANAYEIIRARFDKVLINKGKIYVELIEKDIPSITRELVQAGIDIYGIETKKKNLEDIFRDIIHNDNVSEKVASHNDSEVTKEVACDDEGGDADVR